VTTRTPTRPRTPARPRASTRAPGATAGSRRTARRGTGRRGRSRRPRRRLPRADRTLLLVLAASVTVGLLIVSGPVELHLASRDRVATLEAQLAALEAENARLEQRRDDLDDPEVVELLAREQQGLVRPGEVPYVLTPPPVDRPRITEPVAPLPAEAPGPVARAAAWLRSLIG
jgi:cell division protein FtsB